MSNSDRIRSVLRDAFAVSQFDDGVTIGLPRLGLWCDLSLGGDELARLSDAQICERILDPAIAALNVAAHRKFDHTHG